MKRSILCLAVAATLAGFVNPLIGADIISSSTEVSPAPAPLTGDERRSISLAGNRILKHTSAALAALADKKSDEAESNIGQGLKLVQIVNSAMPASTVTTEIKSGSLSYTDSDPVRSTFVPIYREYDTVDVLSAVSAQKQSKGGGVGPGGVPDVAYAGFDYTGVKLDLRLAKQDLAAAEELIKKGDTKGATAALQEILGTGVVFQFSSMDEPLVRAMDNLRLAESELKASHPSEAKFALTGASDALRNYETMTGDGRSKDVAALRKEIDEDSKELSKETPETFTPKVAGWWERCRNYLRTL
jgi:hypothetical protein